MEHIKVPKKYWKKYRTHEGPKYRKKNDDEHMKAHKKKRMITMSQE
jgi:hypothetical protein